jgi:hypothetical protein
VIGITTDPTDRTTIFQLKLIRTHASVTLPAQKAIYDAIIATVFQHPRSITPAPAEGRTNGEGVLGLSASLGRTTDAA